MHKNLLLFLFPSHKIIGSPVRPDIQPWTSMVSRRLSISCPPPPFHPADMRREPPPLSHLSVGEFWWSDMTVKPECKQKDPKYSCMIRGFTVVLTSVLSSATISPLHHPLGRLSCLFQLGCHLAHLVGPWLSKVAYRLFLECLSPSLKRSGLPAWLLQEQSYLHRLKPGSPPRVTCGNHSCNSASCLTTLRTILSKWGQRMWSPWLSFNSLLSSPWAFINYRFWLFYSALIAYSVLFFN